MSQKKVDAYKAAKAKRKETAKKEQTKKDLLRVLAWVLAIALIGGLGFAIYKSIENRIKAAGNADDVYKATDYLLPDIANIESTASEHDHDHDHESESATESEAPATESEAPAPESEAPNQSEPDSEAPEKE